MASPRCLAAPRLQRGVCCAEFETQFYIPTSDTEPYTPRCKRVPMFVSEFKKSTRSITDNEITF
jgi:hypothetical protein